MSDVELDQAIVKAIKETNKHDDDHISTIREDSNESNIVSSTRSAPPDEHGNASEYKITE